MEIEQHQEYDDAGETMGAIDGLLNNDNDGDEMGNNNNNDDDNGASGATVSRELESSDKREIGNEAVWTLSTAKPGNGVDQLRDDNIDTFWQSDGPQPHLINIQFHKKMRIKEIALYTDYKLDESYTPSKISIRSGTGFHDIQVYVV